MVCLNDFPDEPMYGLVIDGERIGDYHKVQDIWFGNYVHIPLYHKVSTAAFNKRVHGFNANAIEYTFLCTADSNVWVDAK